MVSKLLAPAFVLVLAGLTAAPAFAGNDDVRGEDALVSSVSYFAQTHPLSCEAAALQMALSHEGLTPSQDDILALIPVDSQPDADPLPPSSGMSTDRRSTAAVTAPTTRPSPAPPISWEGG